MDSYEAKIVQDNGVAFVRKEYKNCDKLWKWWSFIGYEYFRTNRHKAFLVATQSNVYKSPDGTNIFISCSNFAYSSRISVNNWSWVSPEAEH